MDPNWEFDCPQFVDFTAPKVVDDDDEADKFFDSEYSSSTYKSEV